MDSRFRFVPFRDPYSPIPELTMAEGDRISRLPDVLLSLILSFLSTKEAVATSILSKRWESIWTKVPVLNLSLKSGSANDFKAFVDRVLLCNDSPSLRLFHLSGLSAKQVSDYHYHSWIRNIMRRDVVEMDLVHVGGVLPAGTFSSKKLTVLKLFGLRTPFWGSFHLPTLLTLHFKFIELPDDLPLKSILMGLPQLEELVLFKCLGSKNMCIYSSSLKRVEIVEEMVFPRRFERTTIDCPSLEYLQIYGGQFSEYRYGNMPSLTEARLHLGLNSKERYDVEVISVLNHASNLKTLKLDIATKKSAPGYTERDQRPLFPNLTHVIVDYDFSSTNCSNFSWRYLVLWILQCAPNIVSFDYFSSKDGKYCTNIRLGDYLPHLGQLNLEEFLPHLANLEEYQPQLPAHSTFPKCMFPTLEVVNASLLDVADADKILLEHLLSNAVNLKVVRINFKGCNVDENTMDAIIGWLNEVPRASSECKLVVSPPQGRGSA